MTTTTHTIDAAGKTLGRTASEVAKILMGKNKPEYVKNKVTGDKVKLINVSKAKVDPRKLSEKLYDQYSGYPGGLKQEKMSDLIARKGMSEVFKLAVYGMIPANRLRAIIMKNLTISE
jgi:large subunit ribosomal protein L13